MLFKGCDLYACRIKGSSDSRFVGEKLMGDQQILGLQKNLLTCKLIRFLNFKNIGDACMQDTFARARTRSKG